MTDGTAGEEILDVDLLAFERGDRDARAAVVDGVMRSLDTGFVFTTSDLAEPFLDEVYGMLTSFFARTPAEKARYDAPGSHGQTGYTGLLVETAAGSGAADWKEMLNWGRSLPEAHPLRRRFPHQYAEQVFPETAVPGITSALTDFHERLAALQARFLRIIALGLGVHEEYFDSMLRHGATLSRAIHYPAMSAAPDRTHVWAAPHGDINLITALPRATAPGLQVQLRHRDAPPGSTPEGTWVDAVPPDGHVVINTGLMLERVTNGVLRAGWHRVVADPSHHDDRLSVVQFLHPSPSTILAPIPTCIDAEHPLRWAPVEAGALLDEVLWDINLIGSGEDSG